MEKLHKTIAYMGKQDPLFMDFTWGAGGTTSELTLDLSKQSQTQHQIMVNMHLTCTNQVKEKCDFGLNGARAAGICNIVALRGDPPVVGLRDGSKVRGTNPNPTLTLTLP